jgi:hypothetical protein
MRESYAIRIKRNLLPPEYLPGYNTRAEVEEALRTMEREQDSIYTIVYVKEYFNRARDPEGNFTISTVAEIREPIN